MRKKTKLVFWDWALIVLVAVVFLAHLSTIGTPYKAYVFDESYYVPAAKCLMNGTACNVEKPQLAHLTIAAGIKIFGDNGVGWRFPTIIPGTLAIVFLYLLVQIFRPKRTAFFAAFMLGFENIWFNISSIAMLDPLAMCLALLATYLFFKKKYIFSGIVFGLALASKEPVLVLLIAVIATVALTVPKFKRDAFKQTSRVVLMVGLPAVLIFLAGFMVYDAVMDTEFSTPFHHVKKMYEHHKYTGDNAREPDATRAARWFSGFKPSPYYLKMHKLGERIVKQPIQYYGQPNLVVHLLIWLSLPFAVVRAFKKEKLPAFALLWLGVWYSIFLAMDVFLRSTYPHHLVIAMPAICIINALFLERFPTKMLIFYAFGVIAWFAFWFPINFLGFV